jgi:hypothetical protein
MSWSVSTLLWRRRAVSEFLLGAIVFGAGSIFGFLVTLSVLKMIADYAEEV